MELRQIIAANIARLRLKSGMTQQELANKLNYTDKAVSKWERAESIPDVSVLQRVAELFGVTVDYLLVDHSSKEIIHAEQAPAPAPEERSSTMFHQTQAYVSNLAALLGYKPIHLTITLMSLALVWLLAIIAFVVLYIAAPDFQAYWLCFVYAVPVSSILLIVLNSIWGRKSYNFVFISILVWSVLLSVYLSFMNERLLMLFLIGVPAQVIIVLWSLLNKKIGGKN